MKNRVTTPHTSAYPNPISFAAGDSLLLGVRDDEYPGWIRATTADGNEGWAPEQAIELTADGSGIARGDYTARELDIELGEVVEVIREFNRWVWARTSDGREGWIPLATIGPLPPSERA